MQEAQAILKELGLPPAQYNEMAGYVLIALCGIEEAGRWRNITRTSKTVTKGIMDWLRETYDKPYAPNTRETFRRQVLHQFMQAHIVDYNPDIPDLPTNSPRAHYKLTEAAHTAIKQYGTAKWTAAAKAFTGSQGKLTELYLKARKMHTIPLKLADDREFQLSPGKHNELQAAVVTEFAPRFAPGAVLLYLGDTEEKMLIVEKAELEKLGVKVDHDKLPDVVLFDKKKNWLYLIEVVTSHGPVSPKRIVELEEMFSKTTAGKIYVSAFPDKAEFKKFLADTAWETEIWLADAPEHMIHLNGDRFLGPR